MKKLIAKALFNIFLIGMAVTLMLHLGLQLFMTERDFKSISSHYFYQIESIMSQNGKNPAWDFVADFFDRIPYEEKSTFYAIDAKTDEILGSTNTEYNGKKASEVGLSVEKVTEELIGGYQTVNGRREYCAAQKRGRVILVHSCSRREMVSMIFWDVVLLCACVSMMFVLLLVASFNFLDRKIIRSIIHINRQLKKIESGNYTVVLSDDYTEELSELCQSINSMTGNLLGFTEKVSKALELSEVPIGICEYEPERNRLLATSRVRDILMLTEDEYQIMLSNPELYGSRKEELFCTDSSLKSHVYRLKRHMDHYVRVEVFDYDMSRMVVLTDVTAEMEEKHAMAKERDTDVLTGLYNTRAGFRIMEAVCAKPEERKTAVLLLIDLDCLKQVNDKYGHISGDRYIAAFAELLQSCTFANRIITRMGGDEFFLLVYGYDSEAEAAEVMEWVQSIRDSHSILMENGDEISLAFSVGYVSCPGEESEVLPMVKLADRRMYEDKEHRKSRNT